MTELGKRLKDKREEKGISIEELQQLTKIQKRYLIAIEEGNYEIMPGKFYARAFVKSYADVVGLDPDVIFDEYANELPRTVNEEIPENIPTASRNRNQTRISTNSSTLFSLLPKFLVGLLIVGVLVAVWVVMLNRDIPEENQQETPEAVESEGEIEIDIGTNEEPTQIPETPVPVEEEPVEEQPQPIEQELVQINTSEAGTPYTEYELKNTDSFVVSIIANPGGRSYIGIVNGHGKSFYKQELRDGNKIDFDFSAENTIEFNIGDITGIKMMINDQPFTFPYETVHQKVKIVYKKE